MRLELAQGIVGKRFDERANDRVGRDCVERVFDEAASTRERLGRCSHPATTRVVEPGHEARRPRKPDIDRKMNAAPTQPFDPAKDRLRFEAELGDDMNIEPGALRRRDLCHQRRFELLVIHARMAVGIARDADALDAAAPENTALDQLLCA